MATNVGAFVGFLAYLTFGAVPSILYGGYMGLTMHHVLFGDSTGFVQKFMVGGGMALGVVSVLFFFLVLGAIVGTLVGLLFPKRELHPSTAFTAEEPKCSKDLADESGVSGHRWCSSAVLAQGF